MWIADNSHECLVLFSSEKKKKKKIKMSSAAVLIGALFTLNMHTLALYHFTACECMQNLWMSGKQCKPWSDAGFGVYPPVIRI